MDTPADGAAVARTARWPVCLASTRHDCAVPLGLAEAATAACFVIATSLQFGIWRRSPLAARAGWTAYHAVRAAPHAGATAPGAHPKHVVQEVR